MKNKQKNFFNKIFTNPIIITILLVTVLSLLSYPLIKKLKIKYNTTKEIKGLQNEIKDLETNNAKLNDLVKYINSEQYVDTNARLSLNYKKPGEEVVTIKNSPNNLEEQKNQDKKNILNSKSNPQKWFDYFFK